MDWKSEAILEEMDTAGVMDTGFGEYPWSNLSAILYSNVSADFFRLLIGVICLAFVLWQACKMNVIQSLFDHFQIFTVFFWMLCWFYGFISRAGGPAAAIIFYPNQRKLSIRQRRNCVLGSKFGSMPTLSWVYLPLKPFFSILFCLLLL